MKCPECNHDNVSDFPFCEGCLNLLPVRSGGGTAFDVDYEPDAVVGRPEAARRPFPWNPESHTERLIGRGGALDELVDAWNTVRSTWTGRIQLLVGDVGMGKARVATTLADRARSLEALARVVQVECPRYGGPFRLWRTVVDALFDIPPHTATNVAVGRIALATREYLPDEADEVAHQVGYLVGYRRDEGLTELERDAAIAAGSGALVRLLAAIAHEPLLVVIGRANRASEASLRLAATLEAALKGKPFMLVMVGSPELTTLLPGWKQFPVTQLLPLPAGPAEDLARMFFEGLEISPDLIGRLVERSGGNPSAMKSLIQYLREADGIRIVGGDWVLDDVLCWELELPEHLEGVLVARMNQMDEFDRAILGQAAVVGRECWLSTLVALGRRGIPQPGSPGATVVDDLPSRIAAALDRLDAQRFLERRDSSIPGEQAWSFRSDLHFEVASSLVPDATRPGMHDTVRQWMELVVGSDAPVHWAGLARHAALAGNNPLAARYKWRAGREALAQPNPAAALQLLQEANTLAARDDHPVRLGIAFDLGDVRMERGDLDGALASYQVGLHLAWQLRHRAKGAEAFVRVAQAKAASNEYADAAGLLENALRLYEQVDDHAGVATACLQLGKIYWLGGRLDEAQVSYRKSERLFDALDDRAGQAKTFNARAGLSYDRGDLNVAKADYERSLELRREGGDDRGVAETLNNMGAVWVGLGAHGKAIKAWKEALDLARRHGLRSLEATLVANLGEGLMSLGRLDEASALLDQAETFALEAGAHRSLTDIALNRASLRLEQRDWDGAEAALERARELADRMDLPRFIAQTERGRGALLAGRASGDSTNRDKLLKAAVKHYRKGAAIYSGAGYDLEEALTREKLASTLRSLGDEDAADREQEAALGLRAKHSAEESSGKV